MRNGVLVRVSLAVLSVSMLGACGFLPASRQQEFSVTGASPVQQAALFRNTDPNINDVLARQYCADGYQRLEQTTVAADPGSLERWRVRCTPYEVRFLPSF